MPISWAYIFKIDKFIGKEENMKKERLDKILASQNLWSRKDIQNLIRKGFVKVNKETVTQKDLKIDPEQNEIKVNNEVLNYKKFIYIMMNKPAGVISASRDPKMQTVIDLVPESLKRKDLFPAGRLDRDTEGLIIITNDGEFAHKILLPKKQIYKTYLAIIDSEVTEKVVGIFKEGIELKDGTKCLPADLEVLKSEVNSLVKIKICEGKFHQIKNMFKSLNMNVIYLKRIKIGGLALDKDLNYGECKELNKIDIEKIFNASNKGL